MCEPIEDEVRNSAFPGGDESVAMMEDERHFSAAGSGSGFRSVPKSLAGREHNQAGVPVQLGIAAALAFLDGSMTARVGCCSLAST
jgi:hypothetical protein